MDLGLESDFARLRTALLGGIPDRVPLYDSVGLHLQAAFLGRPSTDTIAGEIEFRLAAGYDYITIQPNYDLTAGLPPQEGERVGGDQYIGERTWAAEERGVITSWEDFHRHPFPEPEDLDYSPFREANRLLPSGMKIIVNKGHIFTDVWRLMGFQTFAYALVDDESLVAAMFERVGALVYGIAQRLVEMEGVGAYLFNDDLGFAHSLLASPSVYRRYQFPWMKKIVELCHQHDLPFIYHTDGCVYEVLEDIVACNVDALHPIEPKAMDIRRLKREYGDRLCLCGNLSQTYPLTFGTPAQVAAETRALIEDLAPGGGYCFGSGHSVQDYVPLENYRVMLQTALEYGRYPIATA
jgi:uroporphyrinogen decarboxylase